jgi:predicted lactoylglutathione lyase
VPTSVFINLPVSDLEAAKRFYTSLGWSLNPAFTDDNAGCIVISDTIYAMLLTHQHFSQFTSKPIADATAVTEVLTALSAESREEVDALADRALASGGSSYSDPQDMGFMYQRAFADPDGHQWEVLWMDPRAAAGDWEYVAETYPDAPRPGA